MRSALNIALFLACVPSVPPAPAAPPPVPPSASGTASGGTEAKVQDHAHHGAMPHRFEGAERWAGVFEDPARDAWQAPDAVLALLGLVPDARVADLGSATGYFAVRLARRVPRGVVYGIDIEPDMVRYLAERAAREKIPNLKSVLGAPDDPKLPEAVDVLLVVDTYHHIEERVGYFRRTRDKLRAGGRLVIVDFKLGQIPVGPPERHRISPARLDEELTAAGYRRVALDERTLPYQYVAMYQAR